MYPYFTSIWLVKGSFLVFYRRLSNRFISYEESTDNQPKIRFFTEYWMGGVVRNLGLFAHLDISLLSTVLGFLESRYELSDL